MIDLSICHDGEVTIGLVVELVVLHCGSLGFLITTLLDGL